MVQIILVWRILSEVVANVWRQHSSPGDERLHALVQLYFIAPGAQKESPALPAVGSGLRLKIGEIDTASLHPHPDRHLRDQSDDQE